MKLPFIEHVADEDVLDNATPFVLEEIRKELRGLIRFIATGPSRREVRTHLDDPAVDMVFGVEADMNESFESYKLKVERYLKDYADTIVIHKHSCNT